MCSYLWLRAWLKSELVWQNKMREFASPLLHLSLSSCLVNTEISKYPSKTIPTLFLKYILRCIHAFPAVVWIHTWFRQHHAVSLQYEPMSRLCGKFMTFIFYRLESKSSLSGLSNLYSYWNFFQSETLCCYEPCNTCRRWPCLLSLQKCYWNTELLTRPRLDLEASEKKTRFPAQVEAKS